MPVINAGKIVNNHINSHKNNHKDLLEIKKINKNNTEITNWGLYKKDN